MPKLIWSKWTLPEGSRSDSWTRVIDRHQRLSSDGYVAQWGHPSTAEINTEYPAWFLRTFIGDWIENEFGGAYTVFDAPPIQYTVGATREFIRIPTPSHAKPVAQNGLADALMRRGLSPGDRRGRSVSAPINAFADGRALFGLTAPLSSSGFEKNAFREALDKI